MPIGVTVNVKCSAMSIHASKNAPMANTPKKIRVWLRNRLLTTVRMLSPLLSASCTSHRRIRRMIVEYKTPVTGSAQIAGRLYIHCRLTPKSICRISPMKVHANAVKNEDTTIMSTASSTASA